MSDMITLLGEYAEELARQDGEIARLKAEVGRLKAGLRECEEELNAYYRMEYPSNLLYSQKKLEQAMASNPATVALKEVSND